MKPLAVIPAYVRSIEDCKVLSRTLTTLRDTAGDTCDLMVVDDGSPEVDLITYCRGLTEAVGGEYIDKGRNEGFSRTVNVGLRRALLEGRDAVLVNADVEFHDKAWLDAMMARENVAGDGLASIVGALLVYPNHLIQHAGIYFSLLFRSFDHIYRYGPENLPEAQFARVCPVTGALQLIRHECLLGVGLYDEQFRMGFEDVDMCVRAWQSGRECIYEPKARAIHHEGLFRGGHRGDPKIEQWQSDSWLHFCAKHGSVSFAEFVPALTVPEDE
jgi:GT2 family glycosyltransferase